MPSLCSSLRILKNPRHELGFEVEAGKRNAGSMQPSSRVCVSLESVSKSRRAATRRVRIACRARSIESSIRDRNRSSMYVFAAKRPPCRAEPTTRPVVIRRAKTARHETLRLDGDPGYLEKPPSGLTWLIMWRTTFASSAAAARSSMRPVKCRNRTYNAPLKAQRSIGSLQAADGWRCRRRCVSDASRAQRARSSSDCEPLWRRSCSGYSRPELRPHQPPSTHPQLRPSDFSAEA